MTPQIGPGTNPSGELEENASERREALRAGPWFMQQCREYAMETKFNLPVGTRIRFIKHLTEPACGDHPAREFARIGDLGEITGHDTKEGYWVKRDVWPSPFGASPDEFEVVPK